MGQKTPLKPFALRSDPPTRAPKKDQQQHVVSFNRRDSDEGQKSAGSDASTCSAYSSGSEGYRRAKRSQKRPPPLKLTSLVTPVISGPQDNPRNRADRLSPPTPHDVPTIVVEPPRSDTSHRMRRR
jgi:hypothetical protein